MKLAYGKLGRSIPLSLESASNVGGDIEVILLLRRLLEDGHTVHVIGRNRNDFTHPNLINHWAPGGLFDDAPPSSRAHGPEFAAYRAFLNDAIRALPEVDATLIWLGQHGTSLHPVPAVQEGKLGTFTNPMGSDVNYGFPLVEYVNQRDVKPFWLCPDPRNMIKFRDLWDPNQRIILAQFNTGKNNTFYDERDGKLRSGSTRYSYSGIEMLAVTPQINILDRLAEPPSQAFGILVNEGYSNLGNKSRLPILQHWCKDLPEYEIFGTWSAPSQLLLKRVITAVPLAEVTNTLRRWRATITLPATGGGWATSKPWECFNAGTICFKHPDYDSQGHIYSRIHMDAELLTFLSPPTVTGLLTRLKQLEDIEVWKKFVRLQWEYYQQSLKRLDYGCRFVYEALGIWGS